MIRIQDGTLLIANDKIANAFKDIFQLFLKKLSRNVILEKYDIVE